jgi:hypothetical protein
MIFRMINRRLWQMLSGLCVSAKSSPERVSRVYFDGGNLIEMISCHFDVKFACVAIQSRSESALTWKTPARCVWDDNEFSRNEIKLESKITLRTIVGLHNTNSKNVLHPHPETSDCWHSRTACRLGVDAGDES